MRRTFISFILFCIFSSSMCSKWAPTQCGPANLITQWGKQVDPQHVLPEYPRPQMVRGDATWKNLNGLWQFQPASSPNEPIPFGKNLSGTILVPFPVESCLSGIGKNYQYLWYRFVFNRPSPFVYQRTLLHFGAVDWNTTVYFQGSLIGTHAGGYDGFSFDITNLIKPTNNELIVFVYDPSDLGFQPQGKQRISAINNPGGDTYTPSSGIWQTVWLENVPSRYISKLTILADTRTLTISAHVSPNGDNVPVKFNVLKGSVLVASGNTTSGNKVEIEIPNPLLWDPNSPFLYDLNVSIAGDSVRSYFGMRSITLAKERHPGTPDTGPQVGIDRSGEDMPGYPIVLSKADYNLCWGLCNKTDGCRAWAYAIPGCDYPNPMCWLKSGNPGTSSQKCRVSGALGTPPFVARRPYLNGGFLFMAGWLDQSWWPDGQYTAPTEEALLFDLQALKMFGLNTVRLHQKVNPERWYYHADRLGIVVMQDMIQKFGGATAESIAPFTQDLKSMILGRYNHPCIIQWEVFNEGDCVAAFNASQLVELVQNMDPSRLVDTNSGGPANDLHIADVNDIHTYPWPGDPSPSDTQYAMLGEFGGIGAYVNGHEWDPGQCGTYLHVDTPEDEAQTYIQMAQIIKSQKVDLSASIYTQISDVENECDGFLNYDRTNKFNDDQTKRIAAANWQLING